MNEEEIRKMVAGEDLDVETMAEAIESLLAKLEAVEAARDTYWEDLVVLTGEAEQWEKETEEAQAAAAAAQQERDEFGRNWAACRRLLERIDGDFLDEDIQADLTQALDAPAVFADEWEAQFLDRLADAQADAAAMREALELVQRRWDESPISWDEWRRKQLAALAPAAGRDLLARLSKAEEKAKRRAQERDEAMVARAFAEDAANGLKARVAELELHAVNLMDRIDGHERRTKADVLLIDRYVKETARLRAVVAGLDSPALLERLADIEHERWSRWMRYLCSKSAIEETFDGPPGTSRIVVPSESAMRWIRQMHTPYDQLTETEKESDRQEVRTTLAAIREHLALDGAPVPAGRDVDPSLLKDTVLKCWSCDTPVSACWIGAHETQVTINDWQRETFPGAGSVEGYIKRAAEEMAELVAAYPGDEASVPGECADVVILLYGVADHAGFDLHKEITRKMAKNRQRRWKMREDGSGHADHVKEGA